MIFLFGEKLIASTEEQGSRDCSVCQRNEDIFSVTEKNYFTVFWIRMLPLDIVAEYLQCAGCGHAFASKTVDEPTFYEPLKSVLAYLLVGYGLDNGVETASNIFHTITGTEVSSSELQEIMHGLGEGSQLSDDLKKIAPGLSWLDKSLIIEAAYLLLFTARPIEYDERLRVNLLANALGVEIEGVNAIIKDLQSQQYKGFQSMQM